MFLLPSRQLQLLVDILVRPIILYCCEFWATEHADIIKKSHLRLCKYVLQVNQ